MLVLSATCARDLPYDTPCQPLIVILGLILDKQRSYTVGMGKHGACNGSCRREIRGLGNFHG